MIWLNPLRRALKIGTLSRLSRATAPSRAKARAPRPAIELLEDRLTPTTFTVLTNSDAVVHNNLSLRDALNKANLDSAGGGSDTIVFDPSLQGKTIILAQGPLLFSGTGSITVNGATDQLTINGGSVNNLVMVNSGVTASLSGFSLINGKIISATANVQAGGIQNNGTLTIDSCTIDGNSAIALGTASTSMGGGIFNTGTLTITNSTVSNSVANAAAQVLGGGIYNSGTLHLSNTQVIGSTTSVSTVQPTPVTASEGTGIYNSGTLTIDTGSAVNNNIASGASTPFLGGGIYCTPTGTLSMDSVTVKGNSATGGGGGIFASAGATISKSNILNNTGGGIHSTGALVLTNTNVNNNTLTENEGGGIFSSGSITMTGGTVSGNTDTCSITVTVGAAMVPTIASAGIYGTAGVSISGTTVSNNTGTSTAAASTDGVGIYSTGTLVIANSTISGNIGSTTGALVIDGIGVYSTGATTITGSTISGNSGSTTGNAAMSGVGIFSTVSLTMDGSTISGNSGTSSSGAINGVGLFVSGTGLITNSTFSGNTSAATGGSAISGIGIFNGGTVTILGSTISANVMASGNGATGGGIFNTGVMTLTESTVYANAAALGGGVENGTAANTSGTITLGECTFVDNTATTNGGAIYNQGQMVLRGTILAKDTAPAGPDIGVNLNVLSKLLGEHDLIQSGSGLEGTEIADGVNENIVGHDPMIFDVLANYGGATNTIPILVGSPALGHGGDTDTTAVIDNVTTTIPVENTAVLMSNFVSRVVQLDDEQMLITAFDPALLTLTVQRGYNGTTAATHVKFTHIFPTLDQLGLFRVVNHTTDIGASTFVKDVTPPVVTITQTPPAITNNTTAVFAFTGTDDLTPQNQIVFKTSLDGGPFTTATSPTTYTGLTAGTHTFQLEGIDLQGNIGTSPVFSWIVDLQAPVVTITQMPPLFSNSASATFAFSGTDNITSPALLVFMTSLDGGNFTTATSPDTITGLTEGVHTFKVEAIDQAGNIGTAPSYQWTVDLTKPTVTITQMPPLLTKNTSAAFAFTGADNITTTANLVFKVSLDGSAFTTATSPMNYTGLSSASHTFSVESMDQAGNVSTPASYTWIVDAIPPTVTLTQKPAAQTMSTSATFAFTGSDNNTPPNLIVFQVSLDGSGFTPATSPVNYTNLAVGSHTFQVEATDQAGNTSVPLSYTWIIDQTPPVATISQGPANPTNQKSATFLFTGSDNVTPPASLVFQVSLDGSSFTTSSSPTSFSGLADGSHTFQVEAIDQAGNVSAPTSYTWVVDTVPPTVSITQTPPTITNLTTGTFAFTGTDNVTPVAQLKYQFSLDGGSFAAATNPLNLAGISSGGHTFEVESIDQAGNISTPATYAWTVDTTPPTVTITATPPKLANGSPAVFDFTGNDNVTPADQLVFQYSLDNGAFTAATSPVTLTGLASGNHNFQVEAIDQAGNVSTPAVYTWTVDSIAPTVTITQMPAFATQNAFGTFAFTGTDNLTPASQLVFMTSLDGSPFAISTSPVALDSLATGTHTFMVEATDLAGNTSTPVSYSWNIDTTAPVASITQKPPATAFVTTATFAFTGTDNVDSPSQLQFKVSLDSAAFVSASSPVSYDKLVLGTHTFQVEAIDRAGNISPIVTYTWQVATPPPASELQLTGTGFGIVRTQSQIGIVVTRTGSVAVPVTVDYATTDGTAVAGTNYQSATGTVTFPIGALTETIPVTILNAGAAGSAGKVFTITLSNATNGATLTANLTKASVTINDPLPQNPVPGNLTAAAAIMTHSTEAESNFVLQAYNVFLHRPPEQNGLSFWTGQLAAGLTDEGLEADFIGSNEYIQNHGGSGAGWVTGMYEDLLGRAPDANGLAFWVGQVQAGISPVSIALGFAASPEREGNILAADYEIYLGRAIDPGSKAFYLSQFANGVQNEDIVAALVGSTEYYNNLAKGQQNKNQWVSSAIEDILHRPASDQDVSSFSSILK